MTSTNPTRSSRSGMVLQGCPKIEARGPQPFTCHGTSPEGDVALSKAVSSLWPRAIPNVIYQQLIFPAAGRRMHSLWENILGRAPQYSLRLGNRSMITQLVKCHHWNSSPSDFEVYPINSNAMLVPIALSGSVATIWWNNSMSDTFFMVQRTKQYV